MTTCAKPYISDGSVSPSEATVDYGATYEVTCNTGFAISGSGAMICGAEGVFDQTPTCQGKIDKTVQLRAKTLSGDVRLFAGAREIPKLPWAPTTEAEGRVLLDAETGLLPERVGDGTQLSGVRHQPVDVRLRGLPGAVSVFMPAPERPPLVAQEAMKIPLRRRPGVLPERSS